MYDDAHEHPTPLTTPLTHPHPTRAEEREKRERENRRTKPLYRETHPRRHHSSVQNAFRYPPEGRGYENMIPGTVRSTPKTDRWCLQLPTTMRHRCDTVNPLHAGVRSEQGSTERSGHPRSPNASRSNTTD